MNNSNKDLLKYGRIESIWNANNTKILKVQQEIWHNGLNEHKVLTATDNDILRNRVRVQIDSWESKWNIILEKKKNEEIKSASVNEALLRTREADDRINELENILCSSLDKGNIIDWELLKNKEKFISAFPVKPSEPKYYSLPLPPNELDGKYHPKNNFISNIIKSIKNKAIEDAKNLYNIDYRNWQDESNRITKMNLKLKEEYEKDLEKYNQKVKEWNLANEDFLKRQKDFNDKIDEFKNKYLAFDIYTIIEYCKMVINKINLPVFIKKDFDIDYNENNKILIIDFLLPNLEEFPNVKEVKYIVTKNELKETYYNSSFIERLYDLTIYKLILRIIHEEFESDVINAMNAISINGWVDYLNKATGKQETACIASIQVKKEEFSDIDLRNVDPKACFKSLKGVASSKLAGITPIQPLLTINKNDKRFVESHNVTTSMDNSTNLAAIPWEEFEHLIREIFQEEFSTNGGEVKVTQASRDGGVDAIAFDPDPIRGGKIVIQAKRYTNTVGVSAVRDLYGTVMNEGATKGILVTTADYGPDAYDFAKNKPITLLNGGNLLYLLEKHGHKAKIDLKEAKILNQVNNN